MKRRKKEAEEIRLLETKRRKSYTTESLRLVAHSPLTGEKASI